jgi:UDP-N-acetylmuramoyl-L-alanyl-D-glutamate--2,6-diaminopimelate ligase
MTLRDHCEKQLWCVFGCGGNRDAGKRPQMGGIAARYADRVVVTSDNPRHENAVEILRDILSGITAQESIEMVADRAEAIRYAIANAADGDVILVAGKGHEDYQLVGDQRLPFSDHKEVRLALRQRGGRQ